MLSTTQRREESGGVAGYSLRFPGSDKVAHAVIRQVEELDNYWVAICDTGEGPERVITQPKLAQCRAAAEDYMLANKDALQELDPGVVLRGGIALTEEEEKDREEREAQKASKGEAKERSASKKKPGSPFCLCGCGDEPKSESGSYVSGHDGRVKGLIARGLRGEPKASDVVPDVLREMQREHPDFMVAGWRLGSLDLDGWTYEEGAAQAELV